MKEITRVVKAYEDAINQNRIVGSQCTSCQDISVPPRPLCKNCGSSEIEITTIEGAGTLLTWTVIHIAPPSHLERVPYILGIVELKNNQKLTGIVELEEGINPDFGMELIADFEEGQEGASRLRWRSRI
ncbi:MAG: OB-fold domain-containing protein [Candidatus Heimdallarchaeota archaeon]|nr:OB-fold domain-containing protein [Candidatus Heimdallarchaeota archaeon]MDH5644557.1 OB-fold domain-containing protein [Candidatus Heimdallarchaeota archaeon]